MTSGDETQELQLRRLTGPAIESIAIDPDREVVVGRTESCDVTLPDGQVSRRHARLVHGDAGWHVVDEQSRHGTYVNSLRIDASEPTSLSDQDLLRIGPWHFLVRIGGVDSESVEDASLDEPAAPPEPAAEPTSTDPYATRATIFLRLRHPDTDCRELSWREFADRYGPVIVGFARRARTPEHEVNDILQDVLMGFFRVADTFEYDARRGRFRGYLKTVTLNAIRSRARRKRPGELPHEHAVMIESRDADDAWSGEWTKQLLQRALVEARGRFEERTFEAFFLYAFQGVPADAVAERLEMTHDSVRQAKSRVSREVREIMGQIRDVEG